MSMDRLLKGNQKTIFTWRRTYLPLIIVPLLLCIFLSIAIFIVTNNQLNRTGQMTVEKFYSQANGIIGELKIVTESLLDNDQFISLVCQDEVSSEDVSTISRIVTKQAANSPYVQETLVISRPHGKIYTNVAVYAYDSLSSLLSSTNAITNTDALSHITEEDLEDGWVMPSSNYSSPYYVSSIRDADGTKKATMVVVLTKGHLYRSLFVQNSAFCCMYNDQFRISSSLKNIPDVDLTSEKDISELVGEPVRIFAMSNDAYTYLTALSRNEFYKPIYIIFIAFAVYMIVLLGYSLLHVRIANKREKEFFSSLVNELPQPVADSSDIQSIFSSIRKALDNYKEEHSAFSEQTKFIDLDRLSHGYLGTNLDAQTISSMNIDPDAAVYYMLHMHFSELGILNPNHRNDLLCIIIETAINGFSEGRFHAVCFPQRNDDICCILNINDKQINIDSIYECIKHVRTLLENDYGTIIRCAVSSPVYDYNDLPSAWQETIDLFRFVHAIDSNAEFVSAEQLEDEPGFLLKGKFVKTLQILTSTLIIGKYEMIPQMIDSILEEHIAPIRKDFSFAQHRLECIKTLLYESPLPETLAEEDVTRIRERIKSVDSISGLSEAVHSCFDDLLADVEDMMPVTRACDYIHDQVSNINLSVPEVADYAGLSVQHLSKLFKASKGMTMVEYINQYRINYSQELLTTTNLNITELSEKAGYANTVTFTRNFKRYVGCTPSEYRQKNR